VATLLLDLLTPEEDQDYEKRFDIDLLTERLASAVDYLGKRAATHALPVGLFGASTGAASALRVAATLPDVVRAVVSRGGRPDLAGGHVLARVRAPTLLIVGGRDHGVIELNERARDALLHCDRELKIVRGRRTFRGAGTLERSPGWRPNGSVRHLTDPRGPTPRGDARPVADALGQDGGARGLLR
jgi:putative phosphoribosyl transferase